MILFFFPFSRCLDFVVIVSLGNDNGLSAVGDAAPERDIARVSAHDLDHTALLVGRRGITNIVDGAHGCIYCGIKSDRVIAAGNVAVNRAGYADYVQSLMRELLRTLKGSVASGDHQCVDSMASADLYRFVLDLRELEFRASLSLQYGPAVLHDVGHYPLRIPFTFSPLESPLRTTARTTAFIPGESPPLVRTPIVLILSLIAFPFLSLCPRLAMRAAAPDITITVYPAPDAFLLPLWPARTPRQNRCFSHFH